VTLVLDSGAMIALERNDRSMWGRLKRALQNEDPPVTHGGIVGQVWRGKGPRQSLLAIALRGLDVRALDESLGRASGELLARSGTSDVIDASLMLLAEDGDEILTSDVEDFVRLAEAHRKNVEVVGVASLRISP
jgi:hypothetical protein